MILCFTRLRTVCGGPAVRIKARFILTQVQLISASIGVICVTCAIGVVAVIGVIGGGVGGGVGICMNSSSVLLALVLLPCRLALLVGQYLVESILEQQIMLMIAKQPASALQYDLGEHVVVRHWKRHRLLVVVVVRVRLECVQLAQLLTCEVTFELVFVAHTLRERLFGHLTLVDLLFHCSLEEKKQTLVEILFKLNIYI